MSGIIGHGNFTAACEDMIAAINEEMRHCGDDMHSYVRLSVARHMVRTGMMFGRAASRLIAGDIGPETYDEEVRL